MKKVLVLMGGMSSEREISLMSGNQVSEALTKSGYDVVKYDLSYDVSDFIRVLNTEKPDVVFNALHGKYGEDGCVQGLLNLMKIPYTHSGVLASSIGMNKDLTRQMAKQSGLGVAEGCLMSKKEFLENEPKKPYVIKPNDDGSSVGVYIVHNETDKDKALCEWPEGECRLIEQYIYGRELSVTVFNDEAMGIVEIIPHIGYYDFKNKYTKGASNHVIPAEISDHIYQMALKQAEIIHKKIGCREVSRSDFRLDDVTCPDKPKLVFLEINTNPGMTELSLVPEIMRMCQNVSYEELVSRLVEGAKCDG